MQKYTEKALNKNVTISEIEYGVPKQFNLNILDTLKLYPCYPAPLKDYLIVIVMMLTSVRVLPNDSLVTILCRFDAAAFTH